MSSVPGDGRHFQHQQSTSLPPVPVHVAASQLLPVSDAASSVQFATGGPPPLLQIHHVPSTPPAASSVLAVDDFSSSASGSSTYGDYGSGSGGGLATMPVPTPTRRMREFIPEAKKDGEYWMKRHKNNEAAKRSREKRRANDVVMMRRIHELAAENKRLKLELDVLRRQLGIVPPHSEPQAQSTRSTLPHPGDVVAVRPKLEPVTSEYSVAAAAAMARDDRLSGTYRPTGVCGVLEHTSGLQQQQQRHNEVHHLHHHPHHQQTAYQSMRPGADWAATCSSNVSFTTSSGADTVQVYRRSISGSNLEPTGVVRRADMPDDDGQPAATWSTYRSPEQTPVPTLSDRLIDTTPIVIFSDVSSSEDSVDETLHGRYVDTVTLRSSVLAVDNGAGGSVVEAPLNLSTPSRHESPVVLRHAYSAEAGPPRRTSSDDFAESWFSAKSSSESLLEPVVVDRLSPPPHQQQQQHGNLAMVTMSGQFEAPTRALYAAAGAGTDWLHACVHDVAHRDLSSRSTSLSSVASVPWQSAVDAAPPHPAPVADHLVLARGQSTGFSDQSAFSSRLPLKVRRKLTSSSTSWTSVDETPSSDYPAPGASFMSAASRRVSDDLRRRISADGTHPALPVDWMPATTVHSRPAMETTNTEMLDADNGRSQ